MGLFSKLLGNANAVDTENLQEKYGDLLADDEVMELGFKLIRDTFILTNKRIIFIGVQGLTGTKVEYKSIVYKAISRFSVETAGHFELDAELKIWMQGEGDPSISAKFNKSVNIYEVQKVLAKYI